MSRHGQKEGLGKRDQWTSIASAWPVTAVNLVEPSSRRSFGSSRSSNTLEMARWNNLAEQFCESFLLQAGEWGEFEVLGTEPDLSALEQERPVRSENQPPGQRPRRKPAANATSGRDRRVRQT